MGGGAGGNFGNTSGTRSISNDKEILYSVPNTINKISYKEIHIGSDGRAYKEIHYTDHGNPKYHKNPHEHTIEWTKDYKPILKNN